MTTTGLKINLKNNNPTYEGDEGTGISIYNQRYILEEDKIAAGESVSNIITILKKCITGNMKGVDTTSSGLFENIKWQKRLDGAFIIPNNHILVFECLNGLKTSYYCYFKDFDGNSWLIYIIDSDKYPVVFDLQENIEPVVTLSGVTEVTESDQVVGYTGTITSISTGNFYIGQKGSTLEYTNITLKNTAFNLPIDQDNENTVTIIPRYAITVDTA